MRFTVVANVIENSRRAFDDLFASFYFAVENTQRVMFETFSASRTHFVEFAGKIRFERFVVFASALLATDAVKVKHQTGNPYA